MLGDGQLIVEPVSTDDAENSRIQMLIILCICVALSLTPWFSASSVMPQLRSAWHISATMAAWLTISVQLGFVFGAVGSAVFNIADIVAPRRLIAVACLGAALANLGLLTVSNPWFALFTRSLTGFFLAGVYPPALKLISTWFNRGRGVALGSVIGALTLGSAMPHLLAALGGVAWHSVIITTSTATVLGGAGILWLMRDGPYPFPQARFDATMLRRALLSRPVLLATGGYLGHMWELYAMWSWLLIFARGVLGRQGDAASLLTFFAIASGAPACIAAGFVADRVGRTKTTMGLMILSGACAATVGLTYHAAPWIFILVSLIWGAAVVADSAQFSAVITEVADPRYVGTALTAQLGLGFALTTVTIWFLPLIAGWLHSWQWVFLILVPGPILGTMSMGALRERAKHESSDTPGGTSPRSPSSG